MGHKEADGVLSIQYRGSVSDCGSCLNGQLQIRIDVDPRWGQIGSQVSLRDGRTALCEAVWGRLEEGLEAEGHPQSIEAQSLHKTC